MTRNCGTGARLSAAWRRGARCDTPRPLDLPSGRKAPSIRSTKSDQAVGNRNHRGDQALWTTGFRDGWPPRRTDHHRLARGGGDPRGPRRCARSADQGRPVAGHGGRRSRRSRHPRRRLRACCRACRSSRKKPPAARRPPRLGDRSSWSIRSTARANCWPGATSSPSISRSSSGGRPTLGIVAAPALGLIWRGRERRRRRAAAACRRARRPATPASAPRSGPGLVRRDGLVAAVSRSHLDAATEAFLARLPVRCDRRLRIGDQVLPGRRRRRRCLSAASARPANGTSPPAMPSLRPPAGA